MRNLSLLLCIFALLPAALRAQSEAPPSEGHQKPVHEHPHARVVDPSRIVTTRKSQIDLPVPGEEDAFTFAVFGDRTGGVPEGVRILEQAVRDVNLLEPDLVMTVGDMIQGYNERPEWLEQMREYKGVMNRLKMPWFPVAGNHDTYWRGENRPRNEHDGDYEEHFGPLWYAFRHKTAWFFALYSDEGDEEGRKSLNTPASQRMSKEQFEWLDATLKKAKDAQHIFLFLHHPRWLGGGYGDDWNRVHARLAEAGNVSAVFAGHIHRMRYDGIKDGIEYFTLATTGGNNSQISADAGYLHHYHFVTVRKGRIAVAAVPVGDVIDARAVTGEISDAARTANEQFRPVFSGQIAVASDEALDATITVTYKNPLKSPLEVSLVPDSKDGRFRFVPDHVHIVIGAEDKQDIRFRVLRDAGPIDAAFDLPKLLVDVDLMTKGARFRLLEVEHLLPVMPKDFGVSRGTTQNKALKVARNSEAAFIPADRADFEDEHFTIEGWLKADRFVNRQGFVTKTEGSEYGFFVNNGEAHFSVHLNGAYVTVRAQEGNRLQPGQWHHLAACYDGEHLTLWVDGKEQSEVKASGPRKRNRLPLYLGADVTREGRATSPLLGEVDEVRISRGRRYPKGDFQPARRLSKDETTLLLITFDQAFGPFYADESGSERHARREAAPRKRN